MKILTLIEDQFKFVALASLDTPQFKSKWWAIVWRICILCGKGGHFSIGVYNILLYRGDNGLGKVWEVVVHIKYVNC